MQFLKVLPMLLHLAKVARPRPPRQQLLRQQRPRQTNSPQVQVYTSLFDGAYCTPTPLALRRPQPPHKTRRMQCVNIAFEDVSSSLKF